MKRGLVLLDPAGRPPADRAARLAAVQERLRADGLAAALIYGDVSRSDDIVYLTNLCIYWNEGILAVPARGEPAFLTKLSKRVHPWMRRTSTVQDLRSGRDLAALSAAYLAESAGGDGRVGIVDARWWPQALLRDLEAALPGGELVDLPDLVRDARLAPSDGELALLREAGGILAGALEDAVRGEGAPAERVSAVELATRGAGFTDVFVSYAAAGEGVSLDATGQFHGLWVRAARATGPVGGALREALDAAARGLRVGARPSELARAARAGGTGAGPGAGSGALSVECVSHADLATGGDHRLGAAEEPLRAGEVVALAAGEGPSSDGAAVCETYRIEEAGAELLTVPAVPGGGHGGMG